MRYPSYLRLAGLVACALTLILSACGESTEPVPTSLSQARTSPLTSPLESPSQVRLGPVPTPLPERGVVTGVLFNQTFDAPMPDTELYLAPLIKSDDGRMEVARFDIKVAPKTRTDSTGQFVFADIAPGRYAIILGGVFDQYLVTDARNGQESIFSLEGGQTVDLDEIWVLPPEG